MTETLVSAWSQARAALEGAGIEEPTFDARLLVELGAGVKRHDILTDPRRELSDADVQAIAQLVARRVQREPMSHILGEKGFRSIVLKVTRDVLTPRPETELLVHLALQNMAEDKPLRVLDFGVGSGAILAAILIERPLATGVGVDISEAAVLVAQSNMEALELDARSEIVRGDWGAGVAGQFDVIVANPPYIPSADIAGLMPEVSVHEPRLALDGGADGLDAYRAIAPQIARLMAPGGIAVFEFGAGQEGAVRGVLAESGLKPEKLYLDLSGVPRAWTVRA